MIDPEVIKDWEQWAENGERDDPPPQGDIRALLSEREERETLLSEVGKSCLLWEERARKAEAEREAMLSVLREVEWSRPAGVDGCLDTCPVCHGEKTWINKRGVEREGHTPSCRLYALLARS